MFQIGEVVSYGATGICTIENIQMLSLTHAAANLQEYYVLRPLASPSCTTYVSTANELLTSKMRRIFTKAEIDALICAVRDEQLEWIEDVRQRADTYGKIVSGGISARLLKLIGCLYLKKKERNASGKKLSATDERLLVSAERIVSEEFSYALQIEQSEVSSYIAARIEG